ncbi:NAD(P)/FAD-dependent oxidoreductase [Alkalicoccus urumqiensis]|uniref:FAD dependent oxidoreductase domain-containing protein n=1 Tax=Alkalicoccus urumqiensis TaxID=1548213 RepID=A0A2P6MFF9_ALKUR|nr:FAD-dependent oxidoreductase [Alkalicoccus urumqiensis]PRO65052.1 hypothetical protein C6I21_11435 [Alkalicoccus urumqiensis]
MRQMFDFLIIGGGVVGTALARRLSHMKGRTALLEKGSRLSGVQSTHNSALVHPPAMMPPDKGTLKSTLGREGSMLHRKLADAFDVPVFQNGAIVTARSPEEFSGLQHLQKAGEKEGIHTMKLLQKEELAALEPNLHPSLHGGLLMPEAMSADTALLTSRLAANAEKNGARIFMNADVAAIRNAGSVFDVETADGRQFQSRFVINAAGAASARIASLIENELPFTPVPRRGEYIVLGKAAEGFMHHIIYPLPTKVTKGILIIPQPDGTIRLGPTDTKQTMFHHALPTEAGIREIKEEVSRLAQNIPYEHTERYYAGVRSSLADLDFYIQPSRSHKRLIHLAGLDSPGVTASPAIAEYVAGSLLPKIETIEEKAAPDRFGY